MSSEPEPAPPLPQTPVTPAELGLKAVQAKKFDVALEHLTKALDEAKSKSPSQLPELLIGRSQAYLGLKRDYDLALEDTERAYHLAGSNIRLVSLAQYRRAVVLGAMKRFADADACCLWSQHLLEGKAKSVGVDEEEEKEVYKNIDSDGNYLLTHDDLPVTLDSRPRDNGIDEASGAPHRPTDAGAEWSRAYMWRGFVLREMQKLPPNDPGRKLTVARVPPKPTTKFTPSKLASDKTPKEATKEAGKENVKPPAAIPAQGKTNIVSVAIPTPAKVPTTAAAAPVPVAPQPPSLRVDMYQSQTKVNLTLYAKGVDSEALGIEPSPETLRFSNLPTSVAGPSGAVTLKLGGTIDETDITKRVTPYKIELQLTKKTIGEKWGRWGEQVAERKDDKAGGNEGDKKDYVLRAVQDSVPAAAPSAPKAAPTIAPTPAATVPDGKKPASPSYPTSHRGGPKNWDKLDDDDDDSKESEKSMDAFFKMVYANSTPEQQRAMNKSFTESNGTSLSTDWASVSKDRVATQPPEGAEAVLWDQKVTK